MTVMIDGATISALLFSHLNSSAGCQYGFLFGEKVQQIQDKVSDSQMHAEDVSSYTYITSFLPWSNPSTVYDRKGSLNKDEIDKMLPSEEQTLIGWYSFRHQSSLRPSLKEMTLHRNLSSYPRFFGSPEDLCFLLCSSTMQPNGPTYTCNHGFLHFLNGKFVKTPMTVMNLGDTTRKEYRQYSNATLTHSSTIQGIFKNQRKQFVQNNGQTDQVVKVDRLASSMNKSLMSMYSQLSESESTCVALEKEVNDLKKQVELLEQEEMSVVFENDETAENLPGPDDQLNKLIAQLGISGPVLSQPAPQPAFSQNEPTTSKKFSLSQNSVVGLSSSPDPDNSQEVRTAAKVCDRIISSETESSMDSVSEQQDKVAVKRHNADKISVKEEKAKRTNMKEEVTDPFASLEKMVNSEKDNLKSIDGKAGRRNQYKRDAKKELASSSKRIKTNQNKSKDTNDNLKPVNGGDSDSSDKSSEKELSLRRENNISEIGEQTQTVPSSSPLY